MLKRFAADCLLPGQDRADVVLVRLIGAGQHAFHPRTLINADTPRQWLVRRYGHIDRTSLENAQHTDNLADVLGHADRHRVASYDAQGLQAAGQATGLIGQLGEAQTAPVLNQCGGLRGAFGLEENGVVQQPVRNGLRGGIDLFADGALGARHQVGQGL